jgi:hypothetical protein
MKNISLTSDWPEAIDILNENLIGIKVDEKLLLTIFTNTALIEEIKGITNIYDLKQYIKLIAEMEDVRIDKISNAPPASSVILKHATKELWAFISSGFNIVQEARYLERIAVCERCPFFDQANSQGFYKIFNKIYTGHKICTKCGCYIYKKAKIASSTCPLPDLEDSSISKWGDKLNIGKPTD